LPRNTLANLISAFSQAKPTVGDLEAFFAVFIAEQISVAKARKVIESFGRKLKVCEKLTHYKKLARLVHSYGF